MTNEELMKNVMDKAVEIIKDEILAVLSYLGEECISRIRMRSQTESWIDQTGNLRSSIGYAVFDYGKKHIGSAFEAIAGPDGTGQEGSAKGKVCIDECAAKFADTYALIVVAGMDYASYVEAMENKDVLASTEVWAKDKIDKYLSDTRERITARINQYMTTL